VLPSETSRACTIRVRRSSSGRLRNDLGSHACLHHRNRRPGTSTEERIPLWESTTRLHPYFPQKGPPGCTKNTCTWPSHLLNINSPALLFPMSVRSYPQPDSNYCVQMDYRGIRLAAPLLVVLHRYISSVPWPSWGLGVCAMTNEPTLLCFFGGFWIPSADLRHLRVRSGCRTARLIS
jgi:hypothetical protein